MLGLGAAGLFAGAGGAEQVGVMLGGAAVYLVSAAVLTLTAVLLHGYADAITEAASGGGALAIEKALLRQKSIWKTVGIIGLVSVAFTALALVLVLVIAVMSAQGILE